MIFSPKRSYLPSLRGCWCLIVVFVILLCKAALAAEFTFDESGTKCIEVDQSSQSNLLKFFNKREANDLGKEGKVYEYSNNETILYSYTNKEICSLALKKIKNYGFKMLPEDNQMPPKSFTSKRDFERYISWMLQFDPTLKKVTANLTETEKQKMEDFCANLAFSENQQSLKIKIDELNEMSTYAAHSKYGLNENQYFGTLRILSWLYQKKFQAPYTPR